MTPPQLLARAGQNANQLAEPGWTGILSTSLTCSATWCGDNPDNPAEDLSAFVEDLRTLKRRLIADAMWDDVLTPEQTRAMIEKHRAANPGWFSGSNTLPVRYASNPPANAADCAGKEGA